MRVYTKTEVAKMAGVTPPAINYSTKAGRLPEADVQVGDSFAYTEDLCKQVIEYFTRRPKWERLNKESN